jgi:hypothetical protein
MGGRIWVESAGIAGEGSTFTFTLPAADHMVAPAPQANGWPWKARSQARGHRALREGSLAVTLPPQTSRPEADEAVAAEPADGDRALTTGADPST